MGYNKIYYDIEVYPNYFCLVFYANQRVVKVNSDNKQALFTMLGYIYENSDNLLFLGYTSKRYDSIIIQLLLNEAPKRPMQEVIDILYTSSKLIIDKEFWGVKLLAYYGDGNKPLPIDLDLAESYYYAWEKRKKESKELYQLMDRFGLTTGQLDVSDFNGGQFLSLKEMGIRIHHTFLQPLPIQPDTNLNEKQKEIILEYCENDVAILYKLCQSVYKDKIELKEDLVEGFELPITDFNKTDRQIVEEILCDPNIKPYEEKFKFRSLFDFHFNTPELHDLLKTYEGITFDKDTKFKKELNLFGLKTTFGLGGIHGIIKNYVVPKGKKLIDIDFASFYPNLIRKFKLLPPTIKDPNIYYNMIDDRVLLKKTNKKKANAYKIVLNIVFGGMNYSYNGTLGNLYYLKGLYSTTITGQFVIMKLVELLNDFGYKTVYINTDGIMLEVNDFDNIDEIEGIGNVFAEQIGISLEYKEYHKGIIRDVNNFILFGDGEPKLKGDYDTAIGKKNHAFGSICYEAMENYLFYDKPIEETINECKDIRKFIFSHKYGKQFTPTYVLDTNTNEQEHFDRYIRYVLSNKKENNILAYNTNTGSWINKELTENVNTLPNLSYYKDNNWSVLPQDIDYQRYYLVAYELVGEITGQRVEDNPYIENIVNELEVLLF